MGYRTSTALALIFGIGIGFAAGFSGPLRAMTLQLTAGGNASCYLGACVGASETATLRQLKAIPPWRGGVSSVVCADENPVRILFFPDFLDQKCQGGGFGIIISNGDQTTELFFANQKLVRIFRAPAIDMSL